MVEIHECSDEGHGHSHSSHFSSSSQNQQNSKSSSSNINFGSSANQRKRRVPRTEQAKTDYADKVFGRGAKTAKEKEKSNYRRV